MPQVMAQACTTQEGSKGSQCQSNPDDNLPSGQQNHSKMHALWLPTCKLHRLHIGARDSEFFTLRLPYLVGRLGASQ